MSRDICICQEFLTEAHRAKIRSAADQAGLVPHFFTPDQFEEAAACLQHCEILYAHSPDLLRSAPASLKWYCCSYAGVDPYCKDPSVFANPDCMLTNSNGYGVTIAEHVVMVTLMLLRRMPEYQSAMAERAWPCLTPIRALTGSRVVVLGTGDVGRSAARRLRALGAAVTGVCRSGRAEEPAFDRVLPVGQLNELLPQADALVMALPATAETAGVLSRERIALLGPQALVVNVGRGSAIDQPALVEALTARRLAGAALDVMEPEPLPPDHPLWQCPNTILTPHVSGNMALGLTCDLDVDMFCRDLGRYAAGESLENLVDRSRGY